MDRKTPFLKAGWCCALMLIHWLAGAQITRNNRPTTLELSAGIGKVIKHSPELLFPAPEAGLSLQATLLLRSSGKYPWQTYWKHPSFGANLFFGDFGNPKILGFGLGMFPSLRLSLPSPKIFSCNLDIGSGIAWTNRRYDVLTNPQNNALSLQWNNITQFRLQVGIKTGMLSPWKLGVALTHLSNGHVKLPNKGINQVGLALNYSFPVRPSSESSGKMSDIDAVLANDSITRSELKRKWGGEVLLGLGFTEYSFEGGPPYKTYFYSGAVSYRNNTFIHLLLGGEFEFNQSTFQFYYLDFEDRKTSIRKASRSAVFTGMSFNFGQLSMRTIIGGYLHLPAESIISSPFYLKVGLQYNLLSDQKKPIPSIGLYLKSHAAVAQYLGLSASCSF
jgi:hypothetical protein